MAAVVGKVSHGGHFPPPPTDTGSDQRLIARGFYFLCFFFFSRQSHVLLKDTIAVMKHHDQKQLEGRAYMSIVTIHQRS